MDPGQRAAGGRHLESDASIAAVIRAFAEADIVDPRLTDEHDEAAALAKLAGVIAATSADAARMPCPVRSGMRWAPRQSGTPSQAGGFLPLAE